jgi:hypothetical protein
MFSQKVPVSEIGNKNLILHPHTPKPCYLISP